MLRGQEDDMTIRYPLRQLCLAAGAGDDAAMVEVPDCARAVLEVSRASPSYQRIWLAVWRLIDGVCRAREETT